jgi:hemolysin activation/secretion protein
MTLLCRSRGSLQAAAAAALLILFAGNVAAQDFQHIAPKQPAKNSPGRVVNENGAPLAGHSGDEVLVKRLKGVFMLSNPKQVRARGVVGRHSLEPGRVAFARQPDFADVVEPYVGQPVTMNSLAHLTRAIVAYYRNHDRPVVNVYVPAQSITSGYVQIVAVESRVEKVDATGARYFSNPMLRYEVDLRPDDPISGDVLRKDLAWINRNPFLQSDILMSPGDLPGTTDLLLRTQDRFPLRVYTGYEDSGTEYTGDDRLLAGFNYGNLFGVGQQLSYQFTMDPTIRKFYAHSATYIIPLPWKHQLTFFGSYSETHADLGPGLDTDGIDWQISARYEVPLPGTTHFTESAIGGFDFKRSNNDLVFGGASVFNTFTDVDQFVLGYQANELDDLGSTSGSLTGFWSPGKFTNYDNDTDYMSQRLGARDTYVYGQLAASRVTRLPFDFTWTERGEVQVANANLLPSEQLGLGGYATVRGYDEREANGDNGFLISTELATPPVSLGDLIGLPKLRDQLQFLGFVDYGSTSLHRVTAADTNPNVNLLGIGPGLRYAIAPYLSLRFDYGFQMIRTGFDDRHDSRAHVGVLVSY